MRPPDRMRTSHRLTRALALALLVSTARCTQPLPPAHDFTFCDPKCNNCISPCFGLFMMVFALSGGLDPATTVALLGLTLALPTSGVLRDGGRWVETYDASWASVKGTKPLLEPFETVRKFLTPPARELDGRESKWIAERKKLREDPPQAVLTAVHVPNATATHLPYATGNATSTIHVAPQLMPIVTAAASPRFRPAALIDGLLRQRERDAEAAGAPPRPPPPNAAAIFALGRAALPAGVT